jgi:hypothetical protein
MGFSTMNSETRPRAAPSSLGNAVWTATSASVLAEILQALSTPTDDPTALRDAAQRTAEPQRKR